MSKNKIKDKIGFIGNDDIFKAFKTTFFTSFTKYIGVILGFLLSIFLARQLGTDNYGFFELANKYFSIFSAFCLFGGGQVITREVSKHNDHKQQGAFLYLTSGFIVSGFLCLISAVIVIIFSKSISNFLFGNSNMTWFIVFVAASLPFQVFSKLFASALIGINKIFVGNLANQIIIVFIVSIEILLRFLTVGIVSLIEVSFYYLIARILMFLFYSIYWFKVVTLFSFNFELKKYLNFARPLMLASATIIFMDGLASIVLGLYHEKSDIAFYSVAYKLSSFVAILLQISNSVLSPKISSLYHNCRVNELNKILFRFTLMLTITGVFVFTIFSIFGKDILGVWGEEFRVAYFILLVLALGQIFNLATGSSGIILVMTGFAKIRRNIAFASLSLNILLLLVFVPKLGALGAAIAVSCTLISDNILKYYYVKKKTEIKIL